MKAPQQLALATSALVGLVAAGCSNGGGEQPLSTIGFASASQSITEGPAPAAGLVVQLSRTEGEDVLVPFTVGGSADPADFTISASPLVIPAGSTTAQIQIAAVDDALDEDEETIVVTLGGPTLGELGSQRSSTTTILDDDPEPSVAFGRRTQDVKEDAGSALVEVVLSAVSGRDVAVPFTVAGTADGNADCTIEPGPLLIPAGQTGGTITITLLDDDEHEGGESVELELQSPVNAVLAADRSHTTEIRDYELGDPLEGLSADELAAFERGRVIFDKRFTPSEGLGPFYNSVSCAGCHSTPVPGGAADLYRNFFLAVYYIGVPQNQSTSIPPFLSAVVPAFGTGDEHQFAQFSLEGGRPHVPNDVAGFPVLSTQRNSIPVFGTGMFEFVSNQTIGQHLDVSDADGDGVSGRFNSQLSGLAIGRFGMKAQVNNIELFTRGPLQNQMGITTDPLEGLGSVVSMARRQVGADPNDPTVDSDGVPDPELAPGDLADLIAFTRFLAPPSPRAFDDAARSGEVLFEQIGCTKCHVPELASSRGPVRAYTDLLIHDMGSDLRDGMQMGDASDTLQEFRTQPLWGISNVGPYLHDGRAATLEQAVQLHGGEGAGARDAFAGLPASAQADLIAFLEHL